MKFHENLKILRKESNFMQKEIAELIGISVRTFQAWEHGDTEPSIDKLIKLADIFNVSLDYLVGREFDPKKNSFSVPVAED